MSNIPEQPRSPSLEDLLRLKRAERPDADFWQDFERGLRQKQLAAIVEPKPWWLGLSIVLGKIPATGWAASAASAGAAAVFAIMAVTAPTATSTSPRDLSQQDSVPITPTSSPVILASAPTETAVAVKNESLAAESVAIATTTSSPTLLASTSASVVALPPAATTGTKADVEHSTLPANATILLASADARAVAANDSLTLQSPPSFLDQTEARLGRLTTPLLEFVASGFSPTPAMITGFAPTNTLTLVTAAESEAPIAQAAISPRQARLLNAAIAYEADEKDLSQARDRVVHRLSTSEELYASVTRLGVRGDRLSVSF